MNDLDSRCPAVRQTSHGVTSLWPDLYKLLAQYLEAKLTSPSPLQPTETLCKEKIIVLFFYTFFITTLWPSIGFVPFCKTCRKWSRVLWLIGLQITCKQDIDCLPTSICSPICMAVLIQKSFSHFLVRAPRNGSVRSAVISFWRRDFGQGENRRGLTTQTLSKANILERYQKLFIL